MAYDSKYGMVETEHGDIPEDEPVVVFRGRDLLLPDTLKSYHTLCVGVNAAPEHLARILETFKEIQKWQHENPDKVQRPTSKSYFDRIASSD